MIHRLQRSRAWLFGKRAEDMACLWLFICGYKIVARRVRISNTEIDILARKRFQKNAIIIVEVKARQDIDQAISSLSAQQLEKLQRASLWLYSHGYMKENDQLRIDLIAICPWRLPKHLRNITL